MRLFDSHAHLTDDSLASDIQDIFARAREAGVESICTIASHLADARTAIDLARESSAPRVLASAGIHPHEAERYTPEALTELDGLARSTDAVVAIGETGLDFHYENAPRALQLESFRAQIELAERTGLPVIVHTRDAANEVAGLIREYSGRVRGVLHCFTGDSELLEAGLTADWYVSFSGIVTFKSFRDIHHVLEVPADRLLIETDSPYLAPVPMRGRRNEPAHVAYTARRVAEIRGVDAEELAEQTYQNACRFFRVAP